MAKTIRDRFQQQDKWQQCDRKVDILVTTGDGVDPVKLRDMEDENIRAPEGPMAVRIQIQPGLSPENLMQFTAS